MAEKQLIVVVGPTGVGKSAYALELARELRIPIISADSRQIYKQMSIGTDAPTPEVMAEVPHFFVGTKSVTENYSAYDYAEDAKQVLADQLSLHDTALVVGGSMMYISALLYGMDDVQTPDPSIREKLWEIYNTEGVAPLRSQLKEVDPDYLKRIDPNNHKRIIRALEVYLSSGKPFSSFHTGSQRTLPYNTRIIGIERPREELYRRINSRVRQMADRGLVKEVKSLLPYRHLNALNTIGYKEIFSYLNGDLTLDESLSLIAKHTRTFARQQIAYFKKMKDIEWLSIP